MKLSYRKSKIFR
jgi:hypothetical protein